jgi:alpha-tubulin suppressor-like RCC1 family protein
MLVPATVAEAWNPAISISAGSYDSCAVTSAGAARCWGGGNDVGQLGDGDYLDHNTAVDVSGLNSGVAQISSNIDSTCALTVGGGVKCWGNNPYGQLGDGTTTKSDVPVDVVGLASGVTQVTAGYAPCALMASGGVKCWGNNTHGELGDGTNTNSDMPIDVPGLSDVAQISGGGSVNCALSTEGGVKCWGYNLYGFLGDGTNVDRNTPVDVVGLSSGVAAISAGGSADCALLTDGGVKCWGYNNEGALGDNFSESFSEVPVDVSGLTTGVAQVSVGFANTCALTIEGGVKCWGRAGSNGDGVDDANAYVPVDVSGLSSGVTQISSGYLHTCAITSEGGLKCWGSDHYGELGDGTQTDAPVPVDTIGFATTPVTVPMPNIQAGQPSFDAAPFDAGSWVDSVSGACVLNAPSTISVPEVGSCQVNFSSGDSGTFQILKDDQTISFGTIADRTPSQGDFTASASASSGLDVSFTAGGPCSVADDLNTTTVHITGDGRCTITAHQPGNDSYGPAPDVSQSFTIAKANQSISFGALPDETYGAADFSVSATATSGLDVTFTSSGVCTVSSDPDIALVHLQAAGSCTITAHQPGNVDVNPAADLAQSFTVWPSASGSAAGGARVSTDPDDVGPTLTIPVTTSVTAPGDTVSGTIDIAEGAASVHPPAGFTFYHQQVDIDTSSVSPVPTPADPLVIVFTIDASLVDGGSTPDVFRTEAGITFQVPTCAGGDGAADPDPCVLEQILGNGNVQVTAYTTSASEWDFANPPPGVHTRIKLLAPKPKKVSQGRAVKLEAKVNATGGRAQGTVSFYLDGVAIGSSPVNSHGVASLKIVATEPVGNHTISAAFDDPHGHFAPCTSTGQTLRILNRH